MILKLALLCLVATLTTLSQATPVKPTCQRPFPPNTTCFNAAPAPKYNGTTQLNNIGVVLFRAFELIDVYGVIDPLQQLAHTNNRLNLFLIAETLDPVTTETVSKVMNPANSSFWPTLTPTHTFADDLDLDILFVPGGLGTMNPNVTAVTDYLKKTYPKVKIFATVCTGAGLAAKAGLLDGKVATTNKSAWKRTQAMGKANWISPARYVVDGKVWSSSGVTAALDLTFALISTYWGVDAAADIAKGLEHIPAKPLDDPFARFFNITPTAPLCHFAKGVSWPELL
ncbi:hypothetical protein Q8F55_005390 [Vanrija albida]|uniref:DJ-1/PfpI domain-containing protein n=1 Tax=Vanrija albida TaxID=181172 RepID=A0ABR3Q2A6_9TREE